MEVQALAALGLYFMVSSYLRFKHWWSRFYSKSVYLYFVYHFASIGYHENIVGYYTSWFENEQLYIQMEICDHSLSVNKGSELLAEGQVLEALYQVSFLVWLLCRFDLV